MRDPLVSVPVITYNSSKYIIEGLESIKAQTYKNIELIISDDCSTDNTVELCQEWLAENKDRFVRVELVTTDKNTGVSGNCNRAVRACQGEWIKMLSGDDKFLPYTIEGYIDYISMHPEVNICFAKLKLTGNNDGRIKNIIRFYNTLFKEIKNPKDQYRRYLKHHYIPGTGLIYRKEIWERIGGYNESYPFCEEYPFTLSILELGERVYYIDRELYVYNILENSLSNGEKPVWRNFRDQKRFFYDIKLKKMIKVGLFIYAYEDFATYYKNNIVFFENASKLRKIYAYALKAISPLTIMRKLNLYHF